VTNANDPISFRIRAFQNPHDLFRLLQLLAEAEAVDQLGEDISEAAIQEQLRAPRHDPQQDRFVVEHPDDPRVLIGQSSIWTATTETNNVAAELSLIVHPLWRRRGIGATLLQYSLARIQQLGALLARIYADPQHIAAVRFLEAHQFHPVSAYTEMRAETLVATRPAPDGFTVQSYAAVNNVPTLVAAYNTCYAQQWGHHQVTADDVERSLSHLDPHGLFLMFTTETRRLVGVCRSAHHPQRSARNGQSTGYIDAPGIIPDYQTPDLYSALLLHAAQWLRRHDQVLELESWGDAPETIALYQTLGFTILHQQIAYQRELVYDDKMTR
jgi:mycothiol synthase